MNKRTPSSTAEHIRTLARTFTCPARRVQTIAWRGTWVELDEIEQLLIGLQRAKHITRIEVIQLQARYLHEAKP
jgi:hypothetical protein